MKYYTVIVVKIDAFESQIINERHFRRIFKECTAGYSLYDC